MLDECLALAQQAPNASNSEPWRFVVVTEAETKAKLAECYATGWAGYRKAIEEKARRRAASRRCWARRSTSPTASTRCPRWCCRASCRARTPAPSASQAGLYGSVIQAAWSFQLAARARGLGTCWTTLHLAARARRRRGARHPVRPRAAGRADHGRLLARHRLQARPAGRARARRALRALALSPPARSRHTRGGTRNARPPTLGP